MKESLLKHIEQYKDGKHYLLAFSGGGDSVYLLLCLHEVFKDSLPEFVQLAYVNYHDSPFVDNEEDIIHYYASLFHLKLHQVDTEFVKEVHKNFEDWARVFRYQLFQDVCKKEGLEGVFCAHHLSDSVETYLIQKERNILPLHYGLSQESVVKGVKVFRPLLSVTKREMASYLNENHILYYDDPTNHDDHTKRNQIRKVLTEEDIHRYEKEIEIENDKLKTLYHQFEQYHDGMDFSTYDNLNENEKLRYIFFLLAPVKSTRKEGICKDAYEFLKKQDSNSLSLNQKYTLYKDRLGFFLSIDTRSIHYCYTLDKAQFYSFPEFDIDLSDISLFNLKKLPVTIRNYQEGDNLSTDLPTKDVKRHLQKQGVPFYGIPIYPVFLTDDKIQCVPFYKDLKEGKVPMKMKILRRSCL